VDESRPGFVSEEGNPETARPSRCGTFRAVFVAEIRMCLVDTPGLGSVFERQHRVTAVCSALEPVVVRAREPPISATKLALWQEIAPALVGIDLRAQQIESARDEERARSAAAFAERVLAEKRAGLRQCWR